MVSVSWKELEANAPELAEFGWQRLNGQVSYFATIRKNNLPRLHPVTPIVGEGHLYLFMEPTSPKRNDLNRGSDTSCTRALLTTLVATASCN